MKLVLIGIQGAGKSTQGNLLSHQLKLPYLSTGHIFREIAKEKTKLGHYVKEILHSGSLVPDDKTIEIVNSYISRPEYKRGYILDGFPRTVNQAKKFKNNVDKVIQLDIPDKEAIWRLAYRDDSAIRDDNTLDAIRKRIELFHQFTDPVIKYYENEGKLVVIDGTQDIKQVNEEILKSLGKQLIKNQIQAWKQKRKTIIAVTGMPGSGKSEAADFFREKKLPVISFGKIINDLVEKKYKTHSEEAHKEAREGIRKEFGKEALAVLSEKHIKDALEKNMTVVVDGMRSWEEYLYLKKKLPEVKIFIVALYADKHLRYKRVSKRKDRANLYGEDRDINELIGTNMGPTIAFADFLIKNNFSVEEFRDKLEIIYRTIYFS